ncbi:G kinase-anchoring protein 1 [Bombyx mori]|uniref:G kinase-anchoring protein 1 n=1 Tax=Bombyx mori TaxID=7091 RepID=A0A8R1WJ10_BOMMO|nr:G kinase-anchoring protein 1 [Bombyx mori]XP_004929659.1 G kinase-anchoring protein 1 [Bombyx mori]XP_012548802.1 G kinase-anchoring protein 1 [Bombyx mori]
MAALVVQSRFAGLMIEDDDHPTNSDEQKHKKAKTNSAKKSELLKKPKNNNNNNNNCKTQSAGKKKKTKLGESTEAQWAQWKQKDEEMVDGNFESELHQAILLSKLDYEEKKDVYKQLKKDVDAANKVAEVSRNVKKLKKKNVMCLEQFNGIVNSTENSDVKFNHNTEDEKNSTDDDKIPEKDTQFFERVKIETKDALIRNKIKERIHNRLTDEVITKIQFNETLEKKDKEIESLKEEVLKLKQELLTVKSRNKKLCSILGQGEMRDKAEVLVEVERLNSVQAELTAEIATLHSELEKERSKNTDPRAKDKKNSTKKKKIRFDVSSEAVVTKESGAGNV